MSRKLLAILALALIGVGPAYAIMGGKRDIPDQTVQTPVGAVTLTHLRYLTQVGVYTLWGDAMNGTDRDWTELVLAVVITDKSGPIPMRTGWGQPSLPTMYIHLSGLRAGAAQEFKFSSFASPDKDTVVPAISYADGNFPVSYRVGLANPVVADIPAYETDRYALLFAVQDKGVHLSLKNKGDAPIRIDWNSVAYVDVAGQSQGVIHNGIRLADRAAPKAPTIVPPGASIGDDIVPVNNVELVNMEWITHPLLPTGPAALKLIGSQFSVFLPLDIDGKTENQSFVFTILGTS